MISIFRIGNLDEPHYLAITSRFYPHMARLFTRGMSQIAPDHIA